MPYGCENDFQIKKHDFFIFLLNAKMGSALQATDNCSSEEEWYDKSFMKECARHKCQTCMPCLLPTKVGSAE